MSVRVSVLALAALLSACHTTPSAPPGATHACAASAQALSGLSDYARQLRQQDASALLAEKARLEALPASPARDLRLALLLRQSGSEVYDPERAMSLLQQTALEPAAEPAEREVAQTLLTSVTPRPQSCEQTGYTQELADRLSAEEQRRQELSARLESTRQELESERSQREKLEKQLEALKSIETQLKRRESEAGK